MTSHVVVGTAGHVDHGKTSLVRALTGVDCDRLPEEKARGISIELGFARWDLGEGFTASVVDVPGHERFVRAMAAGAAGIDVVVLVVAADDGVMPQTREHLAICDLLGVKAGVVAVTKADTVDDDLLALVLDDIATLVQGTFLENSPKIVCSSVDRRGLDELRGAVREAARAASPRPLDGPFFLPIDRVFTVAGFGTVATGTLLRGRLRAGDEVDALPGPRGEALAGLRVRGLHVHDVAVDEALAARRVAVNVRGEGVEGLKRGAALASPGWQRPTTALIAEVRLLPGVDPIDRRCPLSLHLGTLQIAVTATPLGPGPLAPGQPGAVRLVSEAPMAAFWGQRLVLRRSERDRQRTVGGGMVVDPAPRFARGGAARAALATPFYQVTSPRERAFTLVHEGRERGVALSEARRRLPPGDDAADLLDSLVKKGRLATVTGDDPIFADPVYVLEAERRLAEALAAFHAARPLLSGAPVADLLGRLPTLLAPWGPAALRRLTSKRVAVEQGGVARLASHDPAVGQSLDRLAALYEAAGLTPPSDEEAQRATGLTPGGFRDAIAELRRRGLLKASNSVFFASSAVEALKGRVAAYFAGHPELSAPDFKEVAGGITRKYAIPLLELLDMESATRRRGDVRLPGPALPPPR